MWFVILFGTIVYNMLFLNPEKCNISYIMMFWSIFNVFSLYISYVAILLCFNIH